MRKLVKNKQCDANFKFYAKFAKLLTFHSILLIFQLMNKDFRLKTTVGNFLDISSFGLENISNSPCLILVHGFKGFKDWGFFPYLGEYYSKKGFFVLSFNFSHNGVGSSESDFNELDKFANNTISLEVSELTEIINAYDEGFFGNNNSNKIILLGHSRGGAVALLSSLVNKKPSYYILLASVAKLDRYTERQKNEWRKKGYFEIINSRTNQIMRLNVCLLDDIENNLNDKLSIEKAAKNLNKPLLIIHGEQDLTVPVIEANMIYNWSNKKVTEIAKIPTAGHTFDIVHPFTGSNSKFDLVIDRIDDFFNKYIKLNLTDF